MDWKHWVSWVMCVALALATGEPSFIAAAIVILALGRKP